MGGEAMTESWFSNLWKSSRKSILVPEKTVIGILAFEVVTLMSKIVHLWNCMSEKEILRLREDVLNSYGIIKLVSEDENLLMQLAFSEIIEDLATVVQSITRLGKRCSDPAYHRLDQIFDCPAENSSQLDGWEFGSKKMEKKAKKMERFVAVTSQLHHEMEVLVELEQTLRRMQSNPDSSQTKLLEFRQKVIWQLQEVRNLKEMSPWSRTYNYTVRLLAKSTVTIIQRLKVVLGVTGTMFLNGSSMSGPLFPSSLPRSRSLLQSSVHPTEHPHASMFYSGPMTKSSPMLGSRTGKNQQLTHTRSDPLPKKHSLLKSNIFVKSGPFRGCMIGSSRSPILDSCMPSRASVSSDATRVDIAGERKDAIACTNKLILSSKSMVSDTLPNTLGKAALSLHYANVIILIERFASSPHLIGPDARDDLYNMLPASIRSTLRARLKSYGKASACDAFDGTLATEWNTAITRILEWLSPLAHNMVRWHSERNFEKQHVSPKATILLVQTLYFADQAKTEAAIVELLMGLNYLCHFAKDATLKALSASTTNRAIDNRLTSNDSITCNA
ncbi:hypothetical protein Drorol1_Dr00026276 [Drosera rotundifolia]